ncbi:MAG: 3-deoxy-D-manno-octulosonic acid transferase [Phycisphaerales bacterium]|nr:3-deoxy-D-manno-octulosonic acid transferase [Phycisphaerales bacterium]
MFGAMTNAVYLVTAVATAPWWSRKTRGGWPERFGRIEPVASKDSDARPRVMLHTVSVGETNAVRALVPLLTPHARVIVTATTDTGLARARELYGEQCEVRRYPLDATFAVRRFLDAAQPDVVGLAELELWPNFVAACQSRGIPVAVMNGRISARSFGGYRKLRPLLKRSFASLSAVAAQDEAYAGRFAALGVPADRVSVAGSMKWDSAPDPATGDVSDRANALAQAMGIDRDRPLLVAGSTGPGEEALIREATPDGVQLLCAPRKPERFDEAAAAMPGCVRRSSGSRGSGDVFLLDTLGELGAAYELADAVVVGRSFGPVDGSVQGSDPMEPAALGKPVLTGPAHANFATVVSALQAAGALRVVARESLGAAIADLFGNGEERASMARAALECVAEHRGSSARNASMLLGLAQARTPG